MAEIAILGMITVILSMQLKQTKPEYAVYITLAGCFMICVSSVNRLEYMVKAFRRIENYMNVDELYMTTLLKVVGISYISEFASNICKDSGCLAVAGQIEVFAKLQILSLSLPIVLALLDTLQELPL